MITRFTDIYQAAGSGGAAPPWDWHSPHPQLVRWAAERKISGAGRSATLPGRGYADDAEFVASLGFRTTGFDFVAGAIEGARRRDLVVESLTLQSITTELRAAAHRRDRPAGGSRPDGAGDRLGPRGRPGVAGAVVAAGPSRHRTVG